MGGIEGLIAIEISFASLQLIIEVEVFPSKEAVIKKDVPLIVLHPLLTILPITLLPTELEKTNLVVGELHDVLSSKILGAGIPSSIVPETTNEVESISPSIA
jgi:hypothetical protein